jgi:hypothetical protein
VWAHKGSIDIEHTFGQPEKFVGLATVVGSHLAFRHPWTQEALK